MSTLAEKIAILRPNPHWARLPLFERKGWRTMAFGEFAESVNERVEPSTAAAEVCVGLDDLDSGSLHIRRWGKGSDVIGTKLRFRKGDIIFGRRRAYQRKLAVAEMDGICSAHAMVARAKPEVVLPEFLPFLMMSDKFMNRAVEISVGSLSPTINWTTLKHEPFTLPPLDQQRRLAEILWAVDDAIQIANSLCEQVNSSRNVFFDEALEEGINKKPNSLRKLGDALAGIVAGKSPKSSSAPSAEDEYGVLKVSAVGDGEYCEAENKALLDPEDFDTDYEVKAGMILVTRCNALLSGIGRACFVEHSRSGLMLSDKTLQLLPESRMIERDFLLYGLRREPYRGFVERSANGTEAKNITQETLRAAPFWIPPLDEQKRILVELGRFSNALKATVNNAARLGVLRAALIDTFIE